MNETFLLIKPDGIRLGLVAIAAAAARLRGLEVVDERPVRLGVDDVTLLWPVLDAVSHPVTVGLTGGYLAAGTCAMLRLSGPDAVGQARAIRKDLRARYGNHMLGNVAHAPDSAAEARRQFELLRREPAERAALRSQIPEHLREGRIGTGFGPEDGPDLAAACRSAIADLVGSSFQPLVRAPLGPPDATHQIVVRDDTVNIADTFVAGLLEVFPELGPAGAVRAMVQIDLADASPIIACTPEQFEGHRSALERSGIANVSLHLAPPVRDLVGVASPTGFE